MAEYNNSTRAALERTRREAQNEMIKNLPKQEFDMVTDLIGKGIYSDGVSNVVEEFQKMEDIRPSQWLQEKAFVKVFIPDQYRESYFYIVDKLNRFPSRQASIEGQCARQSICEAMDEGTTQAFLTLLEVIENNRGTARRCV